MDFTWPSDWAPLAVDMATGLAAAVVVGVLLGIASIVLAELRG
jgi:hypothetical protein